MIGGLLWGVATGALASEADPEGVAVEVAEVSVAAKPVQWAGRFVASGSRRVPIIGTITYRTETRTLATVEPSETGVRLQQRTCAVVFEKSAGATLAMNPRGPAGIPTFHLSFERQAQGWTAQPWASGWGPEDLDGDGSPGITIDVSAPLCGGSLMVASDALTTPSRIVDLGDGVMGDVQVWTEQTVLQARGLCLRLFTKSSAETLTGRFAYGVVPGEATCDDVDWQSLPDPRDGL